MGLQAGYPVLCSWFEVGVVEFVCFAVGWVVGGSIGCCLVVEAWNVA